MRYTVPREVCRSIESTKNPLLHGDKLHSNQKAGAGSLRKPMKHGKANIWEMSIDNYINRIICGDCLTVMREMPDDSVDLIVTSPPLDSYAPYELLLIIVFMLTLSTAPYILVLKGRGFTVQ